MTTYVALLRAVNVGGRNKVGMSDLRELAAGLGMKDVRSLLQSGNLVFRAGSRATSRLEHDLERAVKKLGVETDFFVRSASEWADIIQDNPFPAEARRDPGHLLVLPLKDTPNRDSVEALQAAITGREAVRVKGRQVYIVYPDGVGRSRLTITLIEKKLGTRGTGRNWNTVLKLGVVANGEA
ncbi:MAG: DUF1697 domain-containing protein [Vicinamibacterales bacterium]|nr:DUF1697 domain-containing protein [Vicinamibacterales bacterium]